MHSEQDFNLSDFFQNPYPLYAQMRAQDKPYRLCPEGDASKSILLFSRYSDAVEIYKQTQIISNDISAIRPEGNARVFEQHLMFKDGADHMRLRRAAAQFFSQSYTSKLLPAIERKAEALLQDLIELPQVDFVKAFAEPLPLYVISTVMGVPEGDMPKVRDWTLGIAEGVDSFQISSERLEKQKVAATEFVMYLHQLISEKQHDLQDDLLSSLIRSAQAEEISSDEVIGMASYLLMAGHETTVTLLGNMVYLFLQNPEQAVKLKNNSSLINSAVEEVLRMESPFQRSSFRITTEAQKIGGYELEAGQQIGVILGAANRDERAFNNPDQFDIERQDNEHLAFGYGLHNCLGKILAREEARIALKLLSPYLTEWRLASEAHWRDTSVVRGLKALPIKTKCG